MTRTFGPVPSRRLGKSLGVNNIPYKVCSYSCVYCQVGRTRRFGTERSEFYDPAEIAEEVSTRVRQCADDGEHIDYLTFVPDGEPTLDENLGRAIEMLRPLGLKIAVISNGSTILKRSVKNDLDKADWVSFKVDSALEQRWKKVDRPHRAVSLSAVLAGIEEFAETFSGTLVTETMLVRDVNDGEDSLESVSEFLGRLQPHAAYLSIPVRPPTEKWVRPPDEGALARAYAILSARVENVEYLIGYEGNAFAASGDPTQDLLNITAVHPMREDAVRGLLNRTRSEWSVVSDLEEQGLLRGVPYADATYYVRSFPRDKVASDTT